MVDLGFRCCLDLILAHLGQGQPKIYGFIVMLGRDVLLKVLMS